MSDTGYGGIERRSGLLGRRRAEQDLWGRVEHIEQVQDAQHLVLERIDSNTAGMVAFLQNGKKTKEFIQTLADGAWWLVSRIVLPIVGAGAVLGAFNPEVVERITKLFHK